MLNGKRGGWGGGGGGGGGEKEEKKKTKQIVPVSRDELILAFATKVVCGKA